MTAGLELAYLGFEVSDLPGWEALLTNVIGLTGNGDNADGSRGYRMDECEQRLFLRPGGRDDVAAVGLAALNRSEFDAALGRLKAAGVAVQKGDESACRARHVTELVSFSDPSGNPLELCLGQRVAATAFASAVAPKGFVTGDMGMGHIVLVTQDLEPTLRFYTDVIGMAVSDRGAEEWAGLTIEAVFLHCNRSHHSIALGAGIPPIIGAQLCCAIDRPAEPGFYTLAVARETSRRFWQRFPTDLPALPWRRPAHPDRRC